MLSVELASFHNKHASEQPNLFKKWVLLTMATYMDCSESSDDGWRSESVSDEGEVCQVTLDRRIQDLLRTGVAQRRSILVQEIHKFPENDPGNKIIV